RGGEKSPPLRGRRKHPGWPQRVLPAPGQARNLRLAVEPQGAQPRRAALVAVEHPGGAADGAGRAVLVPRPGPEEGPRTRPFPFPGGGGQEAGGQAAGAAGLGGVFPGRRPLYRGRGQEGDRRSRQTHREAAMNLFVEDPEWGWWIILYFYLGGIAAGAY